MSALPLSATIRLRKLAYEILPTPFRQPRDAVAERCTMLATRSGASAAAFRGDCKPDQFAIGMTLYSPWRSDPMAGRDRYQEAYAAAAGMAPDFSANMYECTNWAFLLRYAVTKVRAEQRTHQVFLQIVDADVHGIMTSWSTKTYGNARFGILNLQLEITPAAREEMIDVGSAPVDRSMLKFSSVLRRIGQECPGIDIAAPFFPVAVNDAFRRSLPNLRVLPDRHAQYGHCFGADPWIALGLDWQADPRANDYALASLALNGYYCGTRLHVPADAHITVEQP